MIQKIIRITSNNLIQLFRYRFSSDGELYLVMLQAYRRSMKKPTQQQKITQMNILSKMLSDKNKNVESTHQTTSIQQNQLKQKLRYLIKLRNFKLFNLQAIKEVQRYINSIWPYLQIYQKACCACLLVQQGYYQVFYQFEKQYINSSMAKTNSERNQQIVMNVLYRYCKYIVYKQITQQESINSAKEVKKIFETMYKEWQLQYESIVKIDQIIKSQPQKQIYQDISTLQINNKNKNKKRSNLQIQVEAILSTLGYKFQREVNVSGYDVDFVVDSKKDNKKIILQVMGSHHFTSQYKLFGKDIIRALILQKFMPLAMVHANDFNIIKGLQNKLQYLQQIIEKKLKVNVNTKNNYQDKNSDWTPTTIQNLQQNLVKMNQYKQHSKKMAQNIQFDLTKRPK